MKVLSLFSGGGLGDYGLELAGMEIVGQVEIDDYCQKILKLRWPDVPKWTDIKNVRGEEVVSQCGAIDLISGGFPCQPHSNIGHRKGNQDERDLWSEMFRVIKEVKPRFVVGENVSGIIGTILDKVLSDLESQDYQTITLVFPAHSIGAPHLRERLFIMANTKSNKPNGVERKAESVNAKRFSRMEFKRNALASGRNFWTTESSMGRVANGIANRVDRLKLLGNGQVVQVVEWIGKQIMEYERKP